MKSQVTLLLICTLFSKVRSLTCQNCVSLLSETCENITCQDQCATVTTSVYMNGTKVRDFNIKSCSMAHDCVSGSMNLRMAKVRVNSKCCSTDLCNTETLPALPQQAPNGRMCYTCDANGCSAKVNCEGDEDRCISASVKQTSKTISMKGCVSKSVCIVPSLTNMVEISVSDLQCCEGNLCNGAESFSRSFLLMLIPLLSSILF